jgi:transcriptional regulator with XRE-family HTH domain
MARRSTIHPTDPIARRLYFSRTALGYDSQEQFAVGAGIARNTYNEYEKAKRPLTLESARRLQRRYGLTLEWLMDGVADRLPHGFVQKLQAANAFDPMPGDVE